MKNLFKHQFVLSVLLVISFSVAQGATIDDFSNPFPPNPDLPASGRPIIFVGTTCDGSACPPGNMVSHLVNDSAYQTGLSGVVGGERNAMIQYVTGTANSGIWAAGNSLSFNHNAGASAVLELEYGLSVDLNANFLVIDATMFYVSVLSGDMYAGPRPVPCTITVTSGRGTPEEATASHTIDLINEGIYSFFFSAFGGVDFTDVDYIKYTFDASSVTSVDFSIGPLTSDGDAVDTEESSWGAVKGLYR
ncbi:MAG: hypothetical protein GF417_07890 [Candidatus Latescibacteria bacterium]|nr:hypothetical protein [bacterium]MBD3424341.1 hypothetical protein [Candidatus Latescibacterota bacterium]